MVHLLGIEQGLVQPLLPPLPAVLQPGGQPLLTTVHTLLAEGLGKRREGERGEGRGRREREEGWGEEIG